jgi:hypothetical protein
MKASTSLLQIADIRLHGQGATLRGQYGFRRCVSLLPGYIRHDDMRPGLAQAAALPMPWPAPVTSAT